MMVLSISAKCTCGNTITAYQNIIKQVEEFRRINAKMKIEGRSVIIEGPSDLQGAEVSATDLRAAAALIIAGLRAKGYTRVVELQHLDRGYVDFAGKLANLGANIERISEEKSESENVVPFDYPTDPLAAELP